MTRCLPLRQNKTTKQVQFMLSIYSLELGQTLFSVLSRMWWHRATPLSPVSGIILHFQRTHNPNPLHPTQRGRALQRGDSAPVQHGPAPAGMALPGRLPSPLTTANHASPALIPVFSVSPGCPHLCEIPGLGLLLGVEGLLLVTN